MSKKARVDVRLEGKPPETFVGDVAMVLTLEENASIFAAGQTKVNAALGVNGPEAVIDLAHHAGRVLMETLLQMGACKEHSAEGVALAVTAGITGALEKSKNAYSCGDHEEDKVSE